MQQDTLKTLMSKYIYIKKIIITKIMTMKPTRPCGKFETNLSQCMQSPHFISYEKLTKVALSCHKMAGGSLLLVEKIGQLLSCGELSGHGMLGTVTAPIPQ